MRVHEETGLTIVRNVPRGGSGWIEIRAHGIAGAVERRRSSARQRLDFESPRSVGGDLERHRALDDDRSLAAIGANRACDVFGLVALIGRHDEARLTVVG